MREILNKIKIDRSRNLPIAKILAEELRDLIRSGHLKNGTLLPTGREMARGLGISYVNAQKALATCASEGLVTRFQKRGTLVNYSAEKEKSIARLLRYLSPSCNSSARVAS